MIRTVRVPEELDGATLERYASPDGGRVAAGGPVAFFDSDAAKSIPVALESAGVVLRLLLKAGTRVGEGAPIALVGEEGDQLGWDPAQIRPVRVSILRRCDECGNEYPVNGLVERVRCLGCGDNQPARAEFWKDYVAESVAEASRGQLAGRNILGGKHGKAAIACLGIPPLCRRCYTVLDWGSLSAAWQRAQAGPTDIHCTSCGEPHQARLPPDWARSVFPKIAFVLGETIGGEPQEAKPVVFKCPSCMAALKIDRAAKRISHCSFCDSDIYLPDDLWLHFNPATRRGRWWILLTP